MPEIEEIFEHSGDNGATGVLGIDSESNLYWNGRPVATEHRITLNIWVNISIIITAIATVVMAVVATLTYFVG